MDPPQAKILGVFGALLRGDASKRFAAGGKFWSIWCITKGEMLQKGPPQAEILGIWCITKGETVPFLIKTSEEILTPRD